MRGRGLIDWRGKCTTATKNYWARAKAQSHCERVRRPANSRHGHHLIDRVMEERRPGPPQLTVKTKREPTVHALGVGYPYLNRN